MIAGIGVDIVDVARVSAALRRTPALASRLFAESELGSVTGRAAPGASLAGYFAAKEAVAKALGAPRGLRWTEVQIGRTAAGQPVVRVTGAVAAVAADLGVSSWHLSISHDGGMCVAMAVAER